MGSMSSAATATFETTTDLAKSAPVARARLQNIDALRGLVMVLMPLDHIRETWFLYVPVGDPVDAHTAMPAIFFARLLVSLCAPIFVVLTGVGVFLFRTNH